MTCNICHTNEVYLDFLPTRETFYHTVPVILTQQLFQFDFQNVRTQFLENYFKMQEND